jgi:polyisoprenoid-binding protein YceI
MLRTFAVLTLSAIATLGAQSAPITLTPTSMVRIEGTSNVHAWHAETATLNAKIEVAAPVEAGSKVQAVTLSIPVMSLKSGKGGLDKNMYKAMHAQQHPNITYRMTSFSSRPENGAYAAVVTGMLTVNGIEKEVSLDAVLSGDAQALKAVGSTKFKMTDFGIKPVTALLGTIRTGDEVTIKFELVGAAARSIAELPNR